MDGESCQTCHAEGAASAELGTMTHDVDADKSGKPNLTGMTDFNGPRDPPALWGLAKTAPYFWDGSVRSLDAAILRPVKGHMKDFVSGNCAGTKSTSDACTAEAADRVAALVAYVKTLDPPTTAFDEGRLTKRRARAARSSSRARAAASSATAARSSPTTSSTTPASRRSRSRVRIGTPGRRT